MKNSDIMAATNKPCVPYNGKTRRDWRRVDFPSFEYKTRIKKLRRVMSDKRLDFLVIYGEPLSWERMGDVRWISGFAGIHGHALVVLPIDGEPRLIIDGSFHGEPMHSYAWMTWIDDIRPVTEGYGLSRMSDELDRTLGRAGFESGTIGFVGDDLLLRGLLKGRDCFNATDLYLRAKAVKSDLELDAMRAAGKATDAGFEEALHAIAVGKTEKKIVGKALDAMYSAGAETAGLIMISGPRSWLKHADPTDRAIVDGDIAYLRGGATVKGYACETSRSMVVGQPTEKQSGLLNDVREAYLGLTSMMRPGVSTRALYEKARRLAGEQGYPKKAGRYSYVDYSVSHGVGTSFLELPTIFHVPEDDSSVFERGMCMAFEPMIIAYDLGTAVVENTLVMLDGGPESLCKVETKLW